MCACASYIVCIATMWLMYLYNIIHKDVPFQVHIAYHFRIENMNAKQSSSNSLFFENCSPWSIDFLILRIKLNRISLLCTCPVLWQAGSYRIIQNIFHIYFFYIFQNLSRKWKPSSLLRVFLFWFVRCFLVIIHVEAGWAQRAH